MVILSSSDCEALTWQNKARIKCRPELHVAKSVFLKPVESPGLRSRQYHDDEFTYLY